MNDRFKFRWYSKIYNEMCDVNCIEPNNEFVNFQQDKFNDISTRINLGNGVLMQCTGLKDKNGKLIYEGDIIKIPENWDEYGMFAGEIREVYFNEGGFRLKPKWDKNSRGNWLEDPKDFEVIGNIYDNPGLLESEG